MAAQKSYVGASVVVFLLYWCFFLPGLIVNILWRNEAMEVKRITGRAPAGMGCLNVMFFLAILPLVLFGSCIASALGLGAAAVATDAATGARSAQVRTTPRPTPAIVRATPRVTASPTPAPTARPDAPPPVVTSLSELRPGVAYQLKQDRPMATDDGDVIVRAGSWVRIDELQNATYNVIGKVEARGQDGTYLGRGYMTFGER